MTDKLQKDLIQQILTYAKKTAPKKQAPLILPFVQQYYAHAPFEDLKERSIKNLYGAAFSHWTLIEQRASREYKRRIFNPQLDTDGWESSHTILMFILDDQPFLVDSLCTEINRLGFTIHFVLHLGGLKVVRNAKHHISEICVNKPTKGVLIEAPIYIEINRQSDPNRLKILGESLDCVINDARMAVEDWQKMEAEIYFALKDLEQHKPPIQEAEIEETNAFLRWLLDNHFTLLGFRYYERIGEGNSAALRLKSNSGLGVLRDTKTSRQLRYYNDLPPKAKELALSNYPIILAKTNTRSTVHGRRYTDYISVKCFDDNGQAIGERWFIGLYTSTVYNSDPKDFPLIRQKFNHVLKRSRLPENGHACKTLEDILKTLPRDDLFHATIDELFGLSIGILHLQDRRCIRLFVRRDIFNRFISCLVYVPSDDFNIELCDRIEAILKKSLDALETSYTTTFSDSLLACIHFTVRIDPKKPQKYSLSRIEQEIIEIGRSWKDGLYQQLIALFGEEKGSALATTYKRSFTAAYRESFSPQIAAKDIVYLEKLISEPSDLQTSIYKPVNATAETVHFKLYHRDTTVPLSDVIPILEKMGLRVLSEQYYCVTYQNNHTAWVNDFNILCAQKLAFDIESMGEIFQSAFDAIWHAKAENDGFNALVLSAKLPWREVVILRAYAKYIKQMGITFSQDYIEQAIFNHSNIAKLLVHLFLDLFNPHNNRLETNIRKQWIDQIKQSLIHVASLDEDRIFRIFLNLIRSTVRTNFFQTDAHGNHKSYVSFKFNPSKIPDLPQPKPFHEIFVYAPHFEGVHLRAGDVARGGIRWSDRREDFRREVLGLMKAQQVKNAVIIPAGAKGGFIPKLIPINLDRDAIQKEGIRCYQDFIRGLLDITDNLHQDTVIPPKDTICLDGDDSYLVVAADKGTATFSDIANAISKEYRYWLYDAFASGGSQGYDHKKIAITARGAWESVKRHFQTLNIDIQKDPITVIGIGDMAGDVFGNGLLLSDKMKLVSVFNGMHIFLDPNPNPATSFKERKRLFNLPRSTWEDYNPKLISKGGGIYNRNLKSIKISNEVKKLLGIEASSLAPNALIQAILKAPVDLLWNGGIGTFVKAKSESHADAGDRANDTSRIDGHELRCKIVSEGGNLGFTQLGRIEYALKGGLINTDFIDNSAGVDCSDHEVNIKILLNDWMARKRMSEKQRDSLLVKMQDEVVQLVLHNNYKQARVVSLAAQQSAPYLNLYQNYLKDITKQGKIDPALEFLPSDEIFAARKAAQQGLTNPEIAVLLAYSKIILKKDMLQSDLINDPYLQSYIEQAFPPILRKSPYKNSLRKHRLAKEIMVTQLSNALVSDMGITFYYQMQNETRASLDNIVRAYVLTTELFNLQAVREKIDALDIPIALQTEMVLEIVRFMRRSVRWFLRNYPKAIPIQQTMDLFLRDIKRLDGAPLASTLTASAKAHIEEKTLEWTAAGVPETIAQQVASTRTLYALLDVIKISHRSGGALLNIAYLYFAVSEVLELETLHDYINDYPSESYWMLCARAMAKGDMSRHLRAITQNIYKFNQKNKSPEQTLEVWLEKNNSVIQHWKTVLAEMKCVQITDFSIVTVLMTELAELVSATQ